MSHSSAASMGTQFPDCTGVSPQCNTAAREAAPTPFVSAGLHRGSAGIELTDEAREQAIQRAAQLIETSMQEWEDTGCFAARGRADHARICMEALVKGRSPEQVARMERELGFL